MDACAIRFGVTHLVKDLVAATKVKVSSPSLVREASQPQPTDAALPKYFSTPMGKGGLDEDWSKGFGGVYIGEITDEGVKNAVEAADFVLLVGSLKSDFNTGKSLPFY